MKLKEIRLKNFRCYEDLTVPLHENLTVLVAPNGQGKTAILDAISIVLKTYVRGFDLGNDGQLSTIIVNDIRIIPDNTLNNMVRQLPTSISVTNYKNKQWTLFRNTEIEDEFYDEKNTIEDEGAKAIYQSSIKKQEYIRDTENETISLPIMAYYGTNRGLGRNDTFATPSYILNNPNYEVNDNDRNIRTFAYHKSMVSASDYREFRRWFDRISMSIINNILRKTSETLKNHHSITDQTLRDFRDYQNKLEVPLNAISKPINKVLNIVGWKNPRVGIMNVLDGIELEHVEYGSLKLNQLSDGIRNIFGMVSDLAYRCYLLNSHLGENAAEETEGIVLIDEVDMHLHPEWQQVILRDLQLAFPKLQFIVTTHSPQVLSTVKKENIRIIRDNKLEEVISNTYGEVSGDVMYRIQGVNPRPPIAERQDLERLTCLIDSGLYETEETKLLLNELIQKLGEHNEAIIRINRSIERQKKIIALKGKS